MDDVRPVIYCRRCKTDVIVMPNKVCPWCDTRLTSRPRAQTERLHRERLERFKAA